MPRDPASSTAASHDRTPKQGVNAVGTRTAETIFDVGGNCCAVSRSRRVAFLVNAEDYFRAFVDAAERAERSIIELATSAVRPRFASTRTTGAPRGPATF
jgi:phosphatidylserine/phosphatidylglycerophosphate/cardiolipin synthase-like enzyme